MAKIYLKLKFIALISYLLTIGSALDMNKLFGYRERHSPDKVVEYDLLQESEFGVPSIEEQVYKYAKEHPDSVFNDWTKSHNNCPHDELDILLEEALSDKHGDSLYILPRGQSLGQIVDSKKPLNSTSTDSSTNKVQTATNDTNETNN